MNGEDDLGVTVKVEKAVDVEGCGESGLGMVWILEILVQINGTEGRRIIEVVGEWEDGLEDVDGWQINGTEGRRIIEVVGESEAILEGVDGWQMLVSVGKSEVMDGDGKLEAV